MTEAIGENIPVDPAHGKGGICWDRHGKRYVDYICGYGPVIVGHADERVNRAVAEQLRRGLLLPFDSESLLELERNLLARFPGMETFHCVKTGSEAVAAALRMARAHTGRQAIIRCGFFGWHDAMVAPDLDWHVHHSERRIPTPILGLRDGDAGDGVWDGIEFEELCRMVESSRGRIAAILLDPVQLVEPIGASLGRIRDLATQSGALLILDELKTGFRIGRAEVQGKYGVWADIVVLGKAVANGFPLAMVLAPAWAKPLVRTSRLKGTFNVEAASIAAALATLEILDREDAPATLEHLGDSLINRTNFMLTDAGLDRLCRCVPFRWPAMPYLWFTALEHREEVKTAFYERMAAKGHLMLSRHMNFVNLAHQIADLHATASAAVDTVRDLAAEHGLI